MGMPSWRYGDQGGHVTCWPSNIDAMLSFRCVVLSMSYLQTNVAFVCGTCRRISVSCRDQHTNKRVPPRSAISRMHVCIGHNLHCTPKGRELIALFAPAISLNTFTANSSRQYENYRYYCLLWLVRLRESPLTRLLVLGKV
jgi:hypothetical protein